MDSRERRESKDRYRDVGIGNSNDSRGSEHGKDRRNNSDRERSTRPLNRDRGRSSYKEYSGGGLGGGKEF